MDRDDTPRGPVGRSIGRVYNRLVTTNLQVADPLPSVGLRATDGYLLNLRSFVTKQASLHLFFGAPTLSAAARRRGMKAIEAIAAGYERLHEAGIAVVGISADSEEQQAEFAKKLELPFLLMSDERRSAIELLGIETVASGKNVNVAKPVAIAVDVDGNVRAILDPVDPDTLVDSAIRALSEPIPAATEDAPAAT
jgi:peroxiredoxin Q/BCP